MYQENTGMYANYEVETNKEIYKESNVGKNYTTSCAGSMHGIVTPPVYECPEERIIHREIVHQVPHICPVNTRIINHHIYKHTYSPCYTCCEENEICNVNEGCCNKF
mgnify:FL=1